MNAAVRVSPTAWMPVSQEYLASMIISSADTLAVDNIEADTTETNGDRRETELVTRMRSCSPSGTNPRVLSRFLLVFAVLALPYVASGEGPSRWPQFRGPTGQGTAEGATLPVHWSERENLVWKTPLPGAGHSSPVIWDRQVWLTAATSDGQELGALCVDRDTGHLLHNITVFRPAHVEEIHHDNTYASPTPVIAGRRVYVHYGRYGTACIDTDTGNVVWRNENLVIEHQGGPGSSPVLYEDRLIVNCDGADDQYVVALDTTTGRERWRTRRSAPFRENPILKRAFSTPLLIEYDGKAQLLSAGADQVHAYDPMTGAELWHVRYEGFSTVPAPAAAHGLAYVCTGFYDPQLLAIRVDGHGDVTDSHVEWTCRKTVPETTSPIVVGDRVFFVSDNGIVTAVDRVTGKRVWYRRIGGNYSASPVTDGRHIYLWGRAGLTQVIAVENRPDVVATNRLDGRIMASPAVWGDALFIRTDQALYRIEDRQR